MLCSGKIRNNCSHDIAKRENRIYKTGKTSLQGRRNEGGAKGGNADGKGNFGLMNYIYKVVDVFLHFMRFVQPCTYHIALTYIKN